MQKKEEIAMYEAEVAKLQKIIDESQNIVFLVEPEHRRKVRFQIFEVRMVCIIRVINILRSRWSATASL
ncbi:MAG: hypothetical protein ACLR2O_09020 [Coprococcus sp.]